MAPPTRTCDMANMDAASVRVSGPPARAAAYPSAVARVIDKVPADRFLTDLADRTVVHGRQMLGATTLDALLDRMLAT